MPIFLYVNTIITIIDAGIVCRSNAIFVLFSDIFQSIFNIDNEYISSNLLFNYV